MSGPQRVGFALVAGALLGAAAMWFARPSAPGEAPDAHAPRPSTSRAMSAATPDELERLRDELARERARREALSEQLAELEAELLRDDGLDVDADTGAAPRGPGRVDAGDASARASGRDVRATSRGERAWFDPDMLLALGIPQEEVDHVREGWERAVMLRLELEDARTRAGEVGARPVIRDELVVEQQTRADLGDDAYDAMLYATGEKNRVIMKDVIDAAPAAIAGVEPGDEVISYDGQRVFYPRDLKRLTGAGERGRSVELRVRRDGDVVRIFVPRGPLGVQLARDTRPPLR